MRAASDDREPREDGGHAGRTAVAVRRGRARSRAQDHEGDRGRPWRQRDRSDPEEATGRDGRKAGPLRPQERQGILRLSREGQGPEEPVVGVERVAAEASRSRYAGYRGVEAAFSGGAGGGGRAHGGRSRHHRYTRGRRRLDPRLRLCAVHRRHAVLYRLHGHEKVRRAVPEAGSQIRLALHATGKLYRESGQRGGGLQAAGSLLSFCVSVIIPMVASEVEASVASTEPQAKSRDVSPTKDIPESHIAY